MLSCFQKKGFYRLGFLTVNYGDMIGYYSNSGVVGKVLMSFFILPLSYMYGFA